VLQEGVSGEHRVVRLNHGGGHLRRGVDTEVELALLSVVDGETLEEERTETRASTTTDRVEDHEPLETGALVSELANTVESEIDHLLSDGVVTTSVVVGGILFSSDKLIRVEERTIGASAHFVDHGGLEIDEDCARDVLALSSLGEEGVEGSIFFVGALVGGHHSVGEDSMLEAEEFPARRSSLDTSLTDVNRNEFSHD